jgi:endo-1,4-beta-xylanase
MPRSLQLVLLSLLALLGTGSAPPATLRQAAAAAGLLVGAAVRPYALSEPAYAETLGREFNMVEPEDAMKWWTVRRNPGVFDFHEGAQIVGFARAHDMKVRGHCLVWDHDNPKWLTTANFTPQQLAHLLQEHIATVMKHYAGQVFAWDVVNEALEEHGKPKDSIWFNQPGIGFSGKGTAYIEQAFRWARDAPLKSLNHRGSGCSVRPSLCIYNDFEQPQVFRRHDSGLRSTDSGLTWANPRQPEP